MPKILELKVINGNLWARLGQPSDFPSGVSLWTPDEQAREKQLAGRDAIEALREGNNRMWREGARYFSVPDSMPKRMQMVRDAFRAMVDAALKKG